MRTGWGVRTWLGQSATIACSICGSRLGGIGVRSVISAERDFAAFLVQFLKAVEAVL